MQSGDVQTAHGLKILVIQDSSCVFIMSANRRVISHLQVGELTDFYSQLLEVVSVFSILFA